MSLGELREHDRKEALEAREAAEKVFELGATLPPKVLDEIYAQVMLDLGLAAGLKSRKLRDLSVKDSDSDSDPDPLC